MIVFALVVGNDTVDVIDTVIAASTWSSLGDMALDVWMNCSACKVELYFGKKYWACSVSTCNRARTRLVFCSVPCWDSHVATLRHRDAWAVEETAPTKEEWERESVETEPIRAPIKRNATGPDHAAPRRVVVDAPAAPHAAVSQAGPALAEAEREILIVVSKMKKYIKDRSGMNCSDSVADALSDHVRAVCDESIRAAGLDGRKTVLDRDVPRIRR